MSRFTSRDGALAAGLVAGVVCAVLTAAARAQSTVPAPDFSANQAAWIAIGNDFIASAQGPKPVSFDPAYPYVPNNARRQPTFRIADLSNPNLKPWAKERMKQANAAVLGGKIAFTPRSSCLPAGVPAFLLFIVEPVFIVQSRAEVIPELGVGNAAARKSNVDRLAVQIVSMMEEPWSLGGNCNCR